MAQQAKNGPDLHIRRLTVCQLRRQLGIDPDRLPISCSFQHLDNRAISGLRRFPVEFGRERASSFVVPLIAARNGSTASLAWLSLSLAGTASSPAPRARRVSGLVVVLMAVSNQSSGTAPGRPSSNAAL